MIRYGLILVLLALMGGCATQNSSGQDQAQQLAVDFCEREGGEVETRQESYTMRQYCHLMEGRVIEVNRLYRAEGLTID
ncbi:DUF333 domain-containing protein [Halomonas sp. PAMB 3264]|uniref:DUF333 domain-containing protein n=1 Tax=Halomonas sp. PAMB 3264 TaxID=3075222 RepID=UPI002897C74E|nr:DUF333 domain-containing protein [Halomonas sp. PAMB 3264]WNL43532.1 DUF333 domain-containing protein [Halomonas sp. PAMB 3264]